MVEAITAELGSMVTAVDVQVRHVHRVIIQMMIMKTKRLIDQSVNT